MQFRAHHETISQLSLLELWKTTIIMTASSDKMVKFWVYRGYNGLLYNFLQNLKGQNISNLYQGTMINPTWNLEVQDGYMDDITMSFVSQVIILEGIIHYL